MRISLILIYLAALLTPLASAYADDFPKPYQVVYTAKYNGMNVEANHALTRDAQTYRMTAVVKGMLGGTNEKEDFHLDRQGRILTDHHLAEKSVFGVASKEELVIDKAAGKAIYTKKKKRRELAIKPGYLGPLSYQLQLRRDLKNREDKTAANTPLSYQVISRGKLKNYQFEILANERIDTALGEIETIKVRRVRKDAKRQTVFWMAPAWNYLVVKIQQREKDGEQYEMLLKTASIDGQTLLLPE